MIRVGRTLIKPAGRVSRALRGIGRLQLIELRRQLLDVASERSLTLHQFAELLHIRSLILLFGFGKLFPKSGRLLSQRGQALLGLAQTLNEPLGAGLTMIAESIDNLLQLMSNLRFALEALDRLCFRLGRGPIPACRYQ